MRLDENFTITNDAHSWTLHYRKEGEINEKTGKPSISRNSWHYGTLLQCLLKYSDEVLKPSESIEELLDTISKSQSIILDALNK